MTNGREISRYRGLTVGFREELKGGFYGRCVEMKKNQSGNVIKKIYEKFYKLDIKNLTLKSYLFPKFVIKMHSILNVSNLKRPLSLLTNVKKEKII